MRKILFSLLLATTVATPAFAQRPNQDDRSTARQEQRAAKSEARQERSQAREQVRAERVQNQAPQRNFTPPERNFSAPERNFTPPARSGGGAYVNERGQPTLERQQIRDNMVQQRQQARDRMQNQDARDRFIGQGQVVQQQQRVQPTNRWANGGWNTNWRNDNRYDWRRYRDHHRSFFHLAIYIDPFGYGYQPFGIGYQLYPAYYSQQYWISDPWDYGLPPPPPGAVWVRYWNDVLLVDMYTGQVIDSIHNFFW
jgi:Ni/Co efflux regulator RcnB